MMSSDQSDAPSTNVTFAELGEIFQKNQSFLLLSHVMPDGDALGSQLALGMSLKALGKTVHMFTENGIPEHLEFMDGIRNITEPCEAPFAVDVVIALDTANKPRLGEKNLRSASLGKLWLNIDHHISNQCYGDINYVDSSSPATGQIVYQLIKALEMPIPNESRDGIYVAVSTDTGSFQYPSTTAETYEMAADLMRMGLNVGKINEMTYDNYPLRRVELMRAMLNTLEISPDGRVAVWCLTNEIREALQTKPEDSEGLIDIIRAIRGVKLAISMEDSDDGKVRVSLRSKDDRINVSEIAAHFGGGGHRLAAGIRFAGPITAAKTRLLDEVYHRLETIF